ncbi:probable glutamate receptor [Panulirus ornatus]|uniref:probable glutamate receptor n=1 Tax=Panulirus ornatus TaxID=150431 RepID=UPI003A8C4BFD
MLMMASVAIVLLILSVAVLPSAAQLPRSSYGEGETLGLAGRAVEAVLARERPPHCSVILLTDGTTSATTVFTEIEWMRTPLGLAMFEVTTKVLGANMTQAQPPWMVDEVRRLRQVSGCVTLVVVSDDPAFLAASAEWSLKGRLLTWPNKLLAVTRRPLQDLPHLYTSFSMMNAMLITLDATGTSTRCSIYVHLPYSPRELQVERVALWSTQRGLKLTTPHLPLFPNKFSRFPYGPIFTVASEEFPPHVVKNLSQKAGEPLSFGGPLAQLLQLLAHNFNFSYTFVRPPDGKWGTKEADGSWSGMVGMVGRKEVDLGLGPFGVSATRAEVVDFTRSVLIDTLRIMGGVGRPEVDPWGFLLPLGPLVWTAILAALLVVTGVVWLLSLCLIRETRTRSGEREPTDGFFLYVRVLLQQDTRGLPGERWLERLVLGSWMVMTLVLTKSYAGNLMSMLAVRYIPQPYQSLRDVLDDPSVTMIWEAGTVYIQYLRAVESGIFREVMDSEEDGRLIYTTTTGYLEAAQTLVVGGRHVLVVEDLTGRVIMADHFSLTGKCDFYASRELFLPVFLSMIGQKDHPIVSALSKSIKYVNEAGFYGYWRKHLSINSTRCVRPPTKITVNTSLSFTNVWGMFVVLAGGHAVALLLLCLELLIVPYLQTQETSPSLSPQAIKLHI